MKPNVQIIVLTHNRESELKSTLSSLLNQDYDNYRISVYDNGSNIDVKAITQSFNTNIIDYVRKNNNLSLWQNMIRALNEVDSEIAFVTHDDDFYFSNFISTQVDFMINNQTPIVFSKGLNWYENQLESLDLLKNISINYKKVNYQIYNYQKLFKEIALHGNFLFAPSFSIDTKIYKDAKLESSDFIMGDLDLWEKLARNNLVTDLKTPLVFYRRNEAQHSSINGYRINEVFRVIKKAFKKGYLNLTRQDIRKIKFRKFKILLVLSAKSFKNKKYYLGFSNLFQSFFTFFFL